MASPGSDAGRHLQLHQPHTEPAPEAAFREAQKWIEAVTGRCFGEKDFRGGLENGILLCELLSSIKPGLVKKINRLPTPIAGLDNLTLFLRGCEELGLKGTQLFDPGDLQDTSTRVYAKGSDCSRRLKNVLITIYWLGKAANSCASYSGPTLDLKEFEGLLSQMRKEAEDCDSPKRSIRDSGYIDCWDSERSDSLSPPRHGREDSFDSLDSFGSRSRQTPSPDVLVARGSSDGRGSDSESDFPHHHRRMPDVRKDDMLARRTSVSEPRTPLPFNQFLPNKSNQTAYMPAPLRRKRPEREEGGRKSWSTATSPIGGDRPFSRSPARSCSEELYRTSLTTNAMSTSIVVTIPLSPSPRDSPDASRKFLPPKVDGAGPGKQGGVSDPGRDDMWARRTSPKHGGASPTHFLPVPATGANQAGGSPGAESETDKPRRRPSWLDDELSPTFSHSASVSDDPESMSMIDVRCEEDVFLNPHSQVRHELMHNQYNKLKEEEDHWQDDLARWKSRRRSVSQDLIKKEEERKMMERLLSGDEGVPQRRKSIKTYKEIVEDKERRERELHDAYRRARTPEEARQVLQRYAQRFSISEAILERLKPKLLERSVSADPSSPLGLAAAFCHLPPLPDFGDVFEPCEEDFRASFGVGGGDGGGVGSAGSGAGSGAGGGANPMQYLRQQSLPAPKFTSTVEAMVTSFTPATAPERPLKALPLLAPKPYSRGDKPAKVDRNLRVNGETEKKMEEKESEDGRQDRPEDGREDSPSPLQFLPCPSSNDTEAPESRITTSSASTTSSPAHAAKQASPTHGSKQASPTHTAKQASPTHTAKQASPTHTAKQASSTHTSAQASPTHTSKQASPTHTSTHVSPTHTPDAGLPGDALAPGISGKAAEEERPSEEAPVKEEEEESSLVTASQWQAPERQDVDEGGPPEKTAPSRPTSLPTELQSEPEAIPLVESELAAIPLVENGSQPLPETEQSRTTDKTTCTTVPGLHTTAPTPDPTGPGSAPDHQSPAQMVETVNQLETSHLAAPLVRPPCASSSTESPVQEPSDISVPPTVLSMVKRGDQWSWDPDEERRRQERWQREQERMLQEKYRREQEKLKEEWERAQREVEEEERKFHEEEQKILEETVAPLTPHSPAPPVPPSPMRNVAPPTTAAPQDNIVRSLADWERKQEMLERQARGSTEDNERTELSTEERSSSQLQKAESADLLTSSGVSEASSRSQHNGQRATRGQGQPRSPQPQPAQEPTWNSKEQKTTSLDRKTGGRRFEAGENAPNSPKSPSYSSDTPPSSPNRSVSGKKLCSSCALPLGKGAAMIIETLSLYFHIQCFKCGICKGQLGDTTTGTDVRIRNGLLNCHQCYIRSRSAGQPTTL
ncbi:LIM and calponin homology domains-containing protein 1 isoform X3 [Alosa sapidissima]|uniref:LIM and calponin homology domains-containing protein 1 isoform X3 n=1 Tax=Alosa sapidissima TaxID=34773 RepID=UPI001C0889C7|nr:LIM and calponin homology domains-containing protein 1 isoform X3 [Alosa sapidissima]